MSHKGHPGHQGVQGVQGDVSDRIDPAFDLNKDQLSKMVEDAMAGADFNAVIDSYFIEIEDRITEEIITANAAQAGGYNLSSAQGCRFLAERIVNNVLRPPHKEEEQHGQEI